MGDDDDDDGKLENHVAEETHSDEIIAHEPELSQDPEEGKSFLLPCKRNSHYTEASSVLVECMTSTPAFLSCG